MEIYKNEIEKVWQEELQFQIERINKCPKNNIQNVFTPYCLCHQIIGELKNNTTIIDKDFAVFNLEFIEILLKDYGIMGNKIWFITDCQHKVNLLKDPNFYGVQYKIVKFNKKGIKNMKIFGGKKFDFILMNPPYQAANGSKDSIWNGFVEKSFALVKDNGYVVSVNPPGWRGAGFFAEKIGKKMTKLQIIYLEMHDNKDGQEIFGTSTCYDWYIIRNSTDPIKTTVVDRNGLKSIIDLQKMPFIPNSMLNEVSSLIAKDDEEKVKILHSFSAYEGRQKWMSKEKINKFIYPCVYSINVKNEAKYYYSNTIEKGHFEIPKIIIGDGCNFGIIKDTKGEYGMTQWAFAIVDRVENFDAIVKALTSEKFQKINRATTTKNTAGIGVVDRNIIPYFRKDFWKKFID
jgi:hypothetical protein